MSSRIEGGGAPLVGLTPERLHAQVPALTAEEARRIVSTMHWPERHRGEPLAGPVRGVRRVALEALRRVFPQARLARLTVRDAQTAQDGFHKLLLEAPDGALLETVRIPLLEPGRFTVCVSSQVGCALACSFCATGRLGLTRNLEAWGIVEQVRHVRASLPPRTIPGQSRPLPPRIHGVVFQGMGEPLANLDRVLAAIDVLTCPSALAVDARNITVSTAGLPSGIRRLAAEAPKVRLALSIGSARAAVRRRLMPISDAHPLAEVLAAAAEHARITGLAPLWALTPLRGENDDADEAAALAELARDFIARSGGVRPRLSLIPYNSIGDTATATDPFLRLAPARESAFHDALVAAGLHPHRRYSGGGEVAAACGQLAAAVR